MRLRLALLALTVGVLAGCGPMIIHHPPPTAPLSAMQPLSEGETRISAVRSQLPSTTGSYPNFITGSHVLRLDRGKP